MIGKSFFYTFVIAGGLLAGCASEHPADDNEESEVAPPSKLYRMEFNASQGDYLDSRASVDESSLNGEQDNVFRWDANDQIMVWTGGDATDLVPCLFTTQDGGLKAAHFVYEGEEVSSSTYFGYYPYAKELDYNKIEINVPTDGTIVQAEKNNSRHLGAYRPMYTSVVTRSESSSELTGMAFKHLTGLLYFRIRNMSGQDSKIEMVTLSCTKQVFSSSAELSYSSATSEVDPLFVLSDTKSESVSLTLGNDGQGVTIANEEIMQAFLPILPVDSLAGTKLTLVLKVDGHDHVSLELDGDDIKVFGKAVYYRFGLTVTHNGIEVEPIIADWETGEDIDIPV